MQYRSGPLVDARGFRPPIPHTAAGRTSRWLKAICLVSTALVLTLDGMLARADPIKWGTVLADDYERGVAEHRPIVVLFYDITTSRHDADVLSMQMLLSPTLTKIAGSAVWSFADVSRELVARNIAKALGISTFPTVSVLKPNGDALEETFRVVGLLPIRMTEVGVLKGLEKAAKK